MNEILDTMGSYVIGGIVLLSLVSFILYFNSNSQETKLSQISQVSIIEVGKIIQNDFNKLGYRVTSGSKIQAISSDSISFNGDIDNDGIVDNITYSTYTQNQTLYLKRSTTGSVTGQWSMPVKSFAIQGYDSTGSPTTQISNIKSVSFTLVTSEKTYNGSQTQVGASWVRVFYPKNL